MSATAALEWSDGTPSLPYEIDESTPRLAIGGRTYYFCSDECRSSFEERPSRYGAR